ncbi:adenylate/guanylate cyclase domain-containing protein [Trichothermofontia sp.]
MSSHPAEVHRGDILVVDDTPNNLRLLATMLTEKGYEVRSVISGKMALMGIQAAPPDLILLDVNMPQMNGYEVCKRLKNDPKTREIPVIFISALDEVADKIKGFQVGGVDYITKPFHVEEVLARVDKQITIQHLQKQLQKEIRDREVAEEKYRSIVENAVNGICQTSPSGQFISANSALARLLGYASIAELINTVTDIQQLYVEPQRRAEFIAYMKRYETVSDFESQIYRKDGSKIWISENMRTVRDQDGQLLYYEGTIQDITERKQTEAELRYQRRKAELLLLNILPQPIAERLKRDAQTIADSFTNATILFADIVDFTGLAATLEPTQLVQLLNDVFSVFDRLVEQHGLEKIKTIGDAYMAVGGVPIPRPGALAAIADLALDMQREITQFQRQDGAPLSLRIGINHGPVIAGVIGTSKFIYDLWGDAVNVASRMESQGEPGKIQVTETVYQRLRHTYHLTPRGEILIKGKGKMQTYWLCDRAEQI